MDEKQEQLNQDGGETLRRRASRLYQEREHYRERYLAALTRQKELEKQNGELLDSVHTLQRLYEELLSSTWWRLGAPLRAVLGGLRGRAKTPAPEAGTSGGFVWEEGMAEEELAAQRRHVFETAPLLSVVVPLYHTPAALLQEMIDSVCAQTYPHWELCLADGSDGEERETERICRARAQKEERIRYIPLGENRGIAGNTNAALAAARGEYVVFLDHDDTLHPAALYELARSIEETGADFLYTDEAVFSAETGEIHALMRKPDFSPDSLRSSNYICHLVAVERQLLGRVGELRGEYDGSQDHDLVLRCTEQARRIVHIPQVLYFWRAGGESAALNAQAKPYAARAGLRAVEAQLGRLGLAGEVSHGAVPGTYRIRYALEKTPLISILIPNREHVEDLSVCLESIFSRSTYPNFEVIVAENGSFTDNIFRYYENAQNTWDNLHVVNWDGPFNYAAINNFAAARARGEYLLLLNNDTQVISPAWMEEMLMYAQRRDVGAVGALLYYPDDTVQHAGMSVTAEHPNRHLGRGEKRGAPGQGGYLDCVRNVDAVTGACLLLRRSLWDEVGGLDETFEVAFNDVDLCLRLRARGCRSVITPFAQLYHNEAKSRGADDSPEKERRFLNEMQRFRIRWLDKKEETL